MYRLIFIAIIVLNFSCRKDKEEIELVDAPVSEAELNSVPPPTFQQLINAYEYVAKKDSTLLNNNVKLTRAVFNRIKANPNARVENAEEMNSGFFDIMHRLTKEEWALIVLNLNIRNAYNASKTVEPSKNAAVEYFPCDSDTKYENSKADGFRHAYWSALMVLETNADFAKDFATAHEAGSTNASATEMDLHNNKIGRELAIKYPTATKAQLIELLLQKKYFYIKEGEKIPENLEGIVFFAGKRQYDVTLKGSITNPDSGGPWEITFDIYQCRENIRGEYTIVRNNQMQKRRYKGKIEGNKIILDISDPYVFENPNGVPPCQNMKMYLSGNEASLKGNWVSSNCSQGGVVNLNK
ncbi:DUF6973 domain-containing protein [Emticicia sp. TH156]|uniref:DUF6973 domain-containing protein n=1 Tax=Emticicia sp. TH156 TaxID=2067454 RepID=UPI000C758896|nr:hypothetical protein [Emticicia sp. TH156]PLK42435.1 hypothetical protein C0V77_20690 [Emticicia sp. TH156]